MEQKRYYYACVLDAVKNYFEYKIKEYEDKIEVLSRIPYLSDKGEPVVWYLLKAEEGIIDPKYEYEI